MIKSRKRCSLSAISLLFLSSVSSCGQSESHENKFDLQSLTPSESVPTIQGSFSPDLLAFLRREANITRPFAWGTMEYHGVVYLVTGIDAHGRLRSASFVTVNGQYVIRNTAAHWMDRARVERADSLDLRDLVTETEYPFQVDILSSRECRAYFVMVVQATNRSFTNGVGDSTQIGIRIINTDASKILSNVLEGPLFLSIKHRSIEDINSDGASDYVVVGSDMIDSIHIWTLAPNCDVEPISFRREGRLWKYAEGNEVFVSHARRNGSYAIHIRNREAITRQKMPYMEVTESVYAWDNTDKVYKRVEKLRWLEK